MGIFVSIEIRGNIDDVWDKTQDPALHEQWDLRFTSIQYLPKDSPTDPQRFLYETRLGFGMRIAGEGESIATREDEKGRRTSSLKFWSDQPQSLIREGSGYWKYEPTANGTHFETGYDYESRFGRAGRAFDRFVFRPLIAWATAWSFDCLRLWVDGVATPGASRQKALIHGLARLSIAFVWIWHGLVPKLIAMDPSETYPLLRMHMDSALATNLVLIAGAGEILVGVATLIFWNIRWLLPAQAIAFLALAASSLVIVPQVATQAFNPISLTACLISLCLIGFVASADLPSAKHCSYRWSVK